jgi:gluconolactonase
MAHTLALEDFRKIALGIQRPEDVVVSKSGRVFASDYQACVAEIFPDGSFVHMGPKGGAPNGLTMDAQQRILVANFGIFDCAPGPLQRFDPLTGEHQTLVAKLEGTALSSCNYPVVDSHGNIWCTHSCYATSWMEALLDRRANGFVFVLRPDGSADIVARDIPFANGCALSPDERYLYVNRTSMCDVVRFEILPGASLGPQEFVCAPLGPHIPFPPPEGFTGTPDPMLGLGYTDGNGFDADGNLWVTLPAANKLVIITPSGAVETVAVDVNSDVLDHPTNVAWGGEDMRDLYIGSLVADYVLKIRSPVPGARAVHQR